MSAPQMSQVAPTPPAKTRVLLIEVYRGDEGGIEFNVQGDLCMLQEVRRLLGRNPSIAEMSPPQISGSDIDVIVNALKSDMRRHPLT